MQQEFDFVSEVEKVFGRCFITETEKESPLGSAIAVSIDKGHKQKKDHLGDRVDILRALIIKHHFPKRETMLEWEFLKRCEKYLDNLLARNDFKLETLIDDWRKKVDITIKVISCESCWFVPPFCRCQ